MKRSEHSLRRDTLVSRLAPLIHTWLIALVLAPIRFYSRFISPAFPRRCKYEPTCSVYAQEAIREHGILRGSIAAAWRLMRCNPWSHGGWDPVTPRHAAGTHKHA